MLAEKEEIMDKVEDLAEHLLFIMKVFRERRNMIPEEIFVNNYTNILKGLIRISKFPLTNIKKLKDEVSLKLIHIL